MAEFTLELRFPVPLADPGRVRVYTEWRGIPFVEPHLEALPAGRSVPVIEGFLEEGRPFLRLRHPDRHGHCDFRVLGLSPTRVLLELAPGWPGGPGPPVLVGRVDRETLVTLSPAEDPPETPPGPPSAADLEALMGPFPERHSLAFRALQPPRPPLEVRCLDCDAPVKQEQAFCSRCGARLLAPPCLHCGQPVTRDRNLRAFYPEENGRYPWHVRWDGRCCACGHQYSARLKVRSGHYSFYDLAREEPGATPPFSGHSEVEIRGDESVYTCYDEWDHRPTLEIRIRRRLPHNVGSSGLQAEERLTLTAEEWQALRAELEGPLRLLLLRRPWSRDTT
jgi:hypothetical protein